MGATGMRSTIKSITKIRSPVQIFDAVGLGLFAVTGAGKAIAIHLEPSAAVLMGMLTGIGGGLARDLLVSEVPVVCTAELYAVAALAGAAVFGDAVFPRSAHRPYRWSRLCRCFASLPSVSLETARSPAARLIFSLCQTASMPATAACSIPASKAPGSRRPRTSSNHEIRGSLSKTPVA